jgi:hypothetical protein
MSGVLFTPLRNTPVSSSGRPYPGALRYFYAAGTTTKVSVYSDSALTTQATNPQIADSAGKFATVYLNPALGTYKTVLTNSGGAQLESDDNIPAAAAITGQSVGEALYPITQAETDADITPTDYTYPELDVRRYGFDAGDTTSDQSAPLQRAYDVAAELGGGIIEIPAADFRASITVEHGGIVFRGQGGVASQTIWRNVGAAAPVTWDNADRGMYGGGLEGISLVNRDSGTYTTTDGLVISSEATGLNQMDYLSFRDVYIRNFRDGISITGRCIWGDFTQVRCESNLRDGLHLTGSDNFSQNNFRLCRFGNSGRHGVYANITFAGLLATANKFDSCTFEQNEENGARITGTYGFAGLSFQSCYMEENAGSIAASDTDPRKVHVHIDTAYAIGLVFDGCTLYGNSAPDVDIDYGIYVDSAAMTAVSGSIDNCRITDAVVGAVYWPNNVFLGINYLSGTSVYTPSLGAVSLSDQNALATWTPGITVNGSATGITYAAQVGRYTVHGRLVTATGYINVSDNGAGTGAVVVTGLPFTAANVTSLLPTMAVAYDGAGGSLAAPVVGRVLPNTTTIALYKPVTGTLTALTDSDIANSTAFSFTAQYFV